MANEENEGTEAPNKEASDPLAAITNIKAEFTRKQDSVLNELSQLKQSLSQMVDTTLQANMRNQNAQQKQEEPDPVLDPKGYKEYIKREMRQEFDQTISSERERNNVMGQLVTNYPELQDANSELTKAAIQIYNQMSPSERQSISSYRAAVAQAAQETGIVPMSKRKTAVQADDDFTINSSSSSGSSNRQQSRNQKKEADLKPETVEFARLLGRPVDDPKYTENLKKAASRKEWTKYKG